MEDFLEKVLNLLKTLNLEKSYSALKIEIKNINYKKNTDLLEEIKGILIRFIKRNFQKFLYNF